MTVPRHKRIPSGIDTSKLDMDLTIKEEEKRKARALVERRTPDEVILKMLGLVKEDEESGKQ